MLDVVFGMVGRVVMVHLFISMLICVDNLHLSAPACKGVYGMWLPVFNNQLEQHLPISVRNDEQHTKDAKLDSQQRLMHD